MSKRKQILFGFLALVLALGLLEAFLALASLASPRVARLLFAGPSVPRLVDDPLLGHRPNPAFPGGDERGFRNAAVPESAEIVALGDSQTYGTGVGVEDTWPKQLARLTGRTVYNMAYPGYGPGHCLALLDEALAFRPRVVVAAFYAGNDLFDSFNIVYNVGSLPELRSSDAAVRAAVAAAEAAEPIAERVTRLFSATSNEPPDSFVARHSRLYGLWRRVLREAGQRLDPTPAADRRWEQARIVARENPRYCELFERGPIRTAFTPEYRLSALDLDDPRIAEGERITLEALRRMNLRAAEAGVRFVAVLIPTKELVFRNLVTEPSDGYRRMLDNEDLLWAATRSFLDAQGIAYVDTLPALRERLEAGQQPYPEDHDGHPNPAGHGAIAAALAERLDQP